MTEARARKPEAGTESLVPSERRSSKMPAGSDASRPRPPRKGTAAAAVFQEEQEHLSVTYDKLKELEEATERQLAKIASDAADDKRAMGEELTVNFATADDILETYADFATMNRVVDAYNISQDINAQKLSDIQLLLRQPYFAKVSLRFKPGEPAQDIYIGNAGISDERCRRLIVDWRSPVAETYYNQDNGPTSYEAHGRVIEADLLLRRQFEIEGSELLACFDTTVAIQDELLLASLAGTRSARMQAITATIQKEQNQVVRHADVPVLLVSGVAGSGKTSVMLQRIAFLFYQQRDSLDPREVTILTPNPVFRRYIDQVLPDMGERNPRMLTWAELAGGLLPSSRSATAADSTALADLERIDEALAAFELAPADFCAISSEGVELVSAASIRKAAEKFSQAPAGPHRVALMREELVRKLKARLARMAARESLHDELAALPWDEQLRLFGGPFDPADEAEAKRLALAYLNERHAGALTAIERDDWLRIDRIGARLLGEANLRAAEWLYLKMGLTGLGDSQAKYVMVDEVQDYTAAQLAVLARYFRRARFLLLGDPNQAIAAHLATFQEMREVFARSHGEVQECQLAISYRSAPSITRLFGSLARMDGKKMQVKSVRREEEAPRIVECEGKPAYEAELARSIREARERTDEEGGLCAIIVPRQREARRLGKRLAKEGLQGLKVIEEQGALPERGVVILALKLAKGLEFDEVIVADASARIFPSDDDVARRRLYTTLSRATRRLTVLSLGDMAFWLAGASKRFKGDGLVARVPKDGA